MIHNSNKVTNIETGKTYWLTEEQLERFFDNRNPFDWQIDRDTTDQNKG